MRNKIYYEWCFETEDENGDIVDNNFADSLKDLKGATGNLVLVRNAGNEMGGLEERHWAYVKDGKLPKFFHDGIKETNIKVPLKFSKELAYFF